VIDRTVALLLMKASPEERFAMFAGKSQFKVFGLSGTMARALDFQKFMALMQAVQVNPILFAKFMQKFSGDKSLRYIMTRLNINPEDIEKDEEELKQAPQDEQAVMGAAAVLGGGGKGGASAAGASAGQGAPLGGGSEVPAAINQLKGPATGLPPNA
jgi:hypothetical protein